MYLRAHKHKHTYAQCAGKIRISTSIIGGACRITHWMNIIEAIQDIFRRVRAPFALLSYRLRSVWLSQNCQCAHYIVGYAKLKTLRWLLEWPRVKLCYLQSFFPNKRQVGRMANDEKKNHSPAIIRNNNHNNFQSIYGISSESHEPVWHENARHLFTLRPRKGIATRECTVADGNEKQFVVLHQNWIGLVCHFDGNVAKQLLDIPS